MPLERFGLAVYASISPRVSPSRVGEGAGGRGLPMTLVLPGRQAEASPTNWRRILSPPAALAGAAVAVGVVTGLAVAAVGPVLPLAVIVAGAGVLAILRDARAGLFAAVAIICLLPYATIPVRVGVTLTLLEAVTLLTLGVLVLRMAFDRGETVVWTPLYMPLGLFVAATAVAFLAGAGRNTTVTTAHDYFKLLLGVGLVALTLQLLRSAREVGVLVAALIAGGGIAATVALVLQRLPVGTTANLLVRLRVVGYPTDRLVRYIEDNPDLARRATGTGVDPNSFAGFLMLALVLAVGQAVAKTPLVPRPVALGAVPPVALALLLTQSRAAALGAAAGVLLLATMRYRRLLPVLVAGAVAAPLLGIGGGFIGRLLDGFRGEDAATRLRFREFGNALALIRAYPVFGVGFGDAPRIDLQTGVSSVYLTVASRTGVIGVALFVTLLGVLLWRLLRVAVRRRAGDGGRDAAGELLLAVAAALVAACATMGLDHYFFNLGFPHMVALFWLLAGMGEVLRRAVVPARE